MRVIVAAFLLIGVVLVADAWSAESELTRRNPTSVEPLAGAETQFGALRTPEGARLRTITTRPAGARGRLPGIYFVQWLSCDTVEIGSSSDGWTEMLTALVRDSGMVVMRLEKAGVGDSEGGPCSALDYETELAHHRLALRRFYENPWVDRRRVFVFGASMGATFAPLVAAGARVRGVAVWGGGARSWFERQLAFERRALELGGAAGADIDVRMRLLARFYSAFLIDQETPQEIAARDPSLGAAWPLATGSNGGTQFGRPIAFHQQANARHWAGAWEALDAPVLALYGEYDWYERRESVELIASVVNRRFPGRAEVHVLEGIDHHFIRYRSEQDAFAGRDGQPDAAAAMAILLPWFASHAE